MEHHLVGSFARAGDDPDLSSDGFGSDRVVAGDHDHFDAGRPTPGELI